MVTLSREVDHKNDFTFNRIKVVFIDITDNLLSHSIIQIIVNHQMIGFKGMHNI